MKVTREASDELGNSHFSYQQLVNILLKSKTSTKSIISQCQQIYVLSLRLIELNGAGYLHCPHQRRRSQNHWAQVEGQEVHPGG